jgi:hypothetical protein
MNLRLALAIAAAPRLRREDAGPGWRARAAAALVKDRVRGRLANFPLGSLRREPGNTILTLVKYR